MSVSGAPPIRAFVFDLGGVVVNWDPRNLYRKLISGDDALEGFLAEIGFGAWNLEQDRGRPFEEGVTVLSRAFPHHAELIEAYHRRWEESLDGPITGTIEIMKELRAAGYPLAALSNWSAEKFALVANSYDFFEWFEPLVISGEERVCKPDRRIFEILLERSGWTAEECFFVDDTPVNVAAAEDFGFQALQFRSPEQLRAELARRGVLG